MKVIHTFPCLLSVYKNQTSDDITLFQTKLELYSNRIVLCISKCNFELQTSIEKYSFEISYKLALKWKCHKDKLSELQFYQFSIQAESDDLLILKGYLDCKTTYSGIKELYSNAELTLQQESTKICTLISRLNGVYHHCRCFKKDLMNKHQIQELLTNVRKLANSKNICRALEFFESSNSYYIVYEELRAIQVVDLTHEDIQSIMFDILQSIKTLIENRIYHSKIQITSFWMDNQMVCKLGALEYTRNTNELCLEYESEMIARAGQIMLQLYQLNFTNDHPGIPDYGNELLLGLLDLNPNAQFTIEEALSHEYFAYFDYNSSPLQHKQIVPKLKDYIIQHSLNSSPQIQSTL